jgi:hypothetical protein
VHTPTVSIAQKLPQSPKTTSNHRLDLFLSAQRKPMNTQDSSSRGAMVQPLPLMPPPYGQPSHSTFNFSFSHSYSPPDEQHPLLSHRQDIQHLPQGHADSNMCTQPGPDWGSCGTPNSTVLVGMPIYQVEYPITSNSGHLQTLLYNHTGDSTFCILSHRHVHSVYAISTS